MRKWNSAHTHTVNSDLLIYHQSHKRMSQRAWMWNVHCWNNKCTHTHRPLSNRMRAVIFPPLILDVSAKWEVKSQIWDVTFRLPPCLLPPSLPPPASLHPSPVLFCTSLFDCISPRLNMTLTQYSAPIWVMVVYRHVELMAFIQSMERLVWVWSKGVLRNWQKKDRDREGRGKGRRGTEKTERDGEHKSLGCNPTSDPMSLLPHSGKITFLYEKKKKRQSHITPGHFSLPNSAKYLWKFHSHFCCDSSHCCGNR